MWSRVGGALAMEHEGDAESEKNDNEALCQCFVTLSYCIVYSDCPGIIIFSGPLPMEKEPIHSDQMDPNAFRIRRLYFSTV